MNLAKIAQRTSLYSRVLRKQHSSRFFTTGFRNNITPENAWFSTIGACTVIGAISGGIINGFDSTDNYCDVVIESTKGVIGGSMVGFVTGVFFPLMLVGGIIGTPVYIYKNNKTDD